MLQTAQAKTLRKLRIKPEEEQLPTLLREMNLYMAGSMMGHRGFGQWVGREAP
jgi:hypothetical protein